MPRSHMVSHVPSLSCMMDKADQALQFVAPQGTNWSLFASTVLRVVEAKEELEIKSDHALQWLDETMISWGLRGEGLPAYECIVPTAI